MANHRKITVKRGKIKLFNWPVNDTENLQARWKT